MTIFTELLKDYLKHTPPKLIEYVDGNLKYLYCHPVRAYHNMNHILACIKEFDKMCETVKFMDDYQVALALFYHDCIYDPKNHDNEQLSAERAMIDLRGLGFCPHIADKVGDLIMLTKHTAPCDHFAGQAVMDIDLTILGAESYIFKDYEWKISQEYSHVAKHIYTVERIKILYSFLKKPFIYQTDYFRDIYECPARENIHNSIEELMKNVDRSLLYKLPKEAKDFL